MLPQTPSENRIKPVRLVIADDHPVFIEGFYAAMRKHPQVLMAGCADNGEELIKLVEETRPDIAFTDIQMPVKDGVAATKEIRERFPDVYVIALSSFDDDSYITDMMEAGASGYLLKNDHIRIILEAIERIMAGELYYTSSVSNRLVALMQRTQYNPKKPFDKPRFTNLERSVMKETSKGLISKEVAQVLGIDVRSVESAKARIIEKTGCRNSAGMVMYAVRNNIIVP